MKRNSRNYDELENVGRIVMKRSNSVPLPPGYRTDLPDLDAINAQVYADFHNQIGRLMQDNELGPIEKAVMVAYFLHGSNASDQIIRRAANITLEQLYQIQKELMATDWLAGPEG